MENQETNNVFPELLQNPAETSIPPGPKPNLAPNRGSHHLPGRAVEPEPPPPPPNVARIPAPTIASIEFVPLTDSRGVLVLIPGPVLAHYRSLGIKTLHLEVPLDSDTSRTGWLTVTEAAREHLEDVDGITLAQATAKISRACDRQKILASGHGRDRRIEPTSFGAWRLAQRERELDRTDKEEMG